VAVPALGERATVAVHPTHGVVEHDRPAVTLEQNVSAVVDNIDPITLDEVLRRVVTPLSSLLTLALGAPAPVISIEARIDGPDLSADPNQSPWLQVSHPILRDERGPVIEGHMQLVRFSDVGIAGLAAWLDVATSLDVIPTLVADQIGAPDSTIQTQLLVLSSAAEGLHRRTHATERRLTAGQAKAARQVIKDAVELDPETRVIALEAMGFMSEPTFAQRLRALAAEGADAVPEATGDTDMWLRRLKAYRNALAHQLPDDDDADSVQRFDEILAMAQSLRWLLGALLLRRTGIPDATLAERHAEHPRYAYFIDAAPLRAPATWRRSQPPGGNRS
jgi:hypothetical protein